MSSRAARKILKERELALAQAASNDVESSEDEQPVFVKKMNAFDMLMAGENLQEQEEEEEEEEHEPKDIQPKPSLATFQKNKKKAAKKKQKKLKQQQLQQEEDEDDDDIQTPPQSKTDPNEPDEIDLALKEVNAKLGELPTVSAESTGPIQKKQRPLLAIDLKLLDADAEMRRLFGSKLIAQEALGRGRQNANQRRRVMMNPALNTKTHLVTPKEHWPRIPNKVGITMNMLQSPSLPSDAEKVPGYFDFTYTQGYQEIQMLFLQCVNSHDPGSINNLVHHYPFHVDALLQCSEIAKHNGDINIAAEYIERALFVFERAFHPLFNLATANCIVPYIYPENRALFLAVSRHISFVARKGCWRTCLELSKLLYSLDPEADPLGALQLMDWYAAKSGERAWIMRCWDEWGGDTGGIVGLPNWSFTVALCVFEDETERKAEDHNDSTDRLRNALLQYPTFPSLLLSKLTLTDPTITNSQLFSLPPGHPRTKSEESIHLLLQLYTERCHHLWKEPSALAWFRATASTLAKTVSLEDPQVLEFTTKRDEMYTDGVPLNVSRHIYCSDFQALVPFLPDEHRALRLDAFDPMPPVAEVDEEERGDGGGIMGSVGWIVERLRGLMAARGAGEGVGDEDDDEDWVDGNEVDEEEEDDDVE